MLVPPWDMVLPLTPRNKSARKLTDGERGSRIGVIGSSHRRRSGGGNGERGKNADRSFLSN